MACSGHGSAASARWAPTAPATAETADGNTAKKPSPAVSTSAPPPRAIAERMIAWWASRSAAYSLPSCRSNAVEPSMSVKT